MQSQRLKIGTRGSPLALWQAANVRDQIIAAHGLALDRAEVCSFRTSGDRIQDQSLMEFGGKGLFTKEIEEALLSGEIDLAVHSMKDMPTILPDGLEIACVLPREDVRDAFVSLHAKSLDQLPEGAVVGTSSLRRQAQIRKMRPDLRLVEFRGNVQTRLRKLSEGMADATLLAVAGLKRLGKEEHISSRIETDVMLPAVAQGAICIEIRSADDAMRTLLTAIHDEETGLCVNAERAFLTELDGSCRTPIAGLARIASGALHFHGQILTPDGARSHETQRSGTPAEGPSLGIDAARELLSRAGTGFFERAG